MNISASTYNQFRTCPRLYYWQTLIKLDRVRQDGARRFGTMFHAGLEAWWREMDGGDVPWRDKDGALVKALGAIAENSRHIETDPFETARAEAMMVAYHARYFELEFSTTHAHEAKGGVELWYDLPLLDEQGQTIPGWRHVGKKDAIKTFNDGRTKPVEHKTTTSEIDLGADYWAGVAVNMQVTMYIDAAQQLGHRTDRLLYDVSRKPGLKPLLATAEDKRQYTKGKGCVECGGRAGGKLGVAKGTGMVLKTVTKAGKKFDVEATCEPCNGTGWSEAPALYAKQRLVDEDVLEYKARICNELAETPDAYFRQADAIRTSDQLAEGRADLVIATGEMGALIILAQEKPGGIAEVHGKRCFPKNTQVCTSLYGRRCDYLDVCSGAANPFDSPLYEIRKRKPKNLAIERSGARP